MRELAAARAAAAGIAMSGFGSPEDIELSRAAGFAEHLTKPIDVPGLEAAIRRVLPEAPAADLPAPTGSAHRATPRCAGPVRPGRIADLLADGQVAASQGYCSAPGPPGPINRKAASSESSPADCRRPGAPGCAGAFCRKS